MYFSLRLPYSPEVSTVFRFKCFVLVVLGVGKYGGVLKFWGFGINLFYSHFLSNEESTVLEIHSVLILCTQLLLLSSLLFLGHFKNHCSRECLRKDPFWHLLLHLYKCVKCTNMYITVVNICQILTGTHLYV